MSTANVTPITAASKRPRAGDSAPPVTLDELDTADPSVLASRQEARFQECRAAWLEVERRRDYAADELKSYRDKIKAATDARDLILRNDEPEQPAILFEQAVDLTKKIDKIEATYARARKRHKTLIAEAESAFRDRLFSDQLPLLLADHSTCGDLVLDGRDLRVGAFVVARGVYYGVTPDPVLRVIGFKLVDGEEWVMLAADGDEANRIEVRPTELAWPPDNVEPTQCVLDVEAKESAEAPAGGAADEGDDPADDSGAAAEPDKPKRGRRARKGAEHDSHGDAFAGAIDDKAVPDAGGDLIAVGSCVMVTGAGGTRPAHVLEVHPSPKGKNHGVVVRYDGDDPTPAHVMAHQCRAVKSDAPTAERPKRPKIKVGDRVTRAAKGAPDEPEDPTGVLVSLDGEHAQVRWDGATYLADETTDPTDSFVLMKVKAKRPSSKPAADLPDPEGERAEVLDELADAFDGPPPGATDSDGAPF